MRSRRICKFIENDFETFGFEPDADARKAAKIKFQKQQF
jgi:hypothetical protein